MRFLAFGYQKLYRKEVSYICLRWYYCINQMKVVSSKMLVKNHHKNYVLHGQNVIWLKKNCEFLCNIARLILVLSAKVPSLSFRKTKRTGAGTSLVSLSVRNLFSNNTLIDYFVRLQATFRTTDFTLLPVPYRRFNQVSEPLAHAAKQVNDKPYYQHSYVR